MPNQELTLSNIHQLLIQEREHTRQLVHEEVSKEVSKEVGKLRDQFQSFIDDNFDPATPLAPAQP